MQKISLECLSRLRKYKNPYPQVWNSVPVRRRAAVLMLLYADMRGELQVLLTQRSKHLTSFGGHVSLPGGKADTETETCWDTALREANEEIGLPLDLEEMYHGSCSASSSLHSSEWPSIVEKALKPSGATSSGCTIEYLTNLPAYMSRNYLVVDPCIAVLRNTNPRSNMSKLDQEWLIEPNQLDSTINESEVEAVFSAPLIRCLSAEKGWYKGRIVDWGGIPRIMHSFNIKRPDNQGSYVCFGLTARMLLDAARIGFHQTPEMDFHDRDGDVEMIEILREKGLFSHEKRPGESKMTFKELVPEPELLAKL